MPKAPPSFQLYPADWLAGTAGLSIASQGVYFRLLCYEWITVDLPFKPAQIARMVGLSEQEFAACWEEICGKFVIDDDGFLRNERLETIRENVLMRSEARQAAGRKGGLKKGLSSAKFLLKQKASKGRLKTEDRRLKTKDRKQKAEDAAFAAFWALVPAGMKTGKRRAIKHYAEAIDRLAEKDDPHGFLAERMTAYAESDRAKGSYPWEPSSWLRDGHYDDDPAAWQGHGGNGKPKSHDSDFDQMMENYANGHK